MGKCREIVDSGELEKLILLLNYEGTEYAEEVASSIKNLDQELVKRISQLDGYVEGVGGDFSIILDQYFGYNHCVPDLCGCYAPDLVQKTFKNA